MNAEVGANSRAALRSGLAALTVGGTCSPASASGARTMVRITNPTSMLPHTPVYRVLQQTYASSCAQLIASSDECCIMPSRHEQHPPSSGSGRAAHVTNLHRVGVNRQRVKT